MLWGNGFHGAWRCCFSWAFGVSGFCEWYGWRVLRVVGGGGVGEGQRKSEDGRSEWEKLRDEVAKARVSAKRIDEHVARLTACLYGLLPPECPTGQ